MLSNMNQQGETFVDPLDTLNAIHAALAVPYDWDADTMDVIAAILAAAGYTFPDEDDSNAIEAIYGLDVPPSALHRYHPANH